MAAITMAEVRAQYPQPSTSLTKKGRARRQGYCVGGALCRVLQYVYFNQSFPSILGVQAALLEVNVLLPRARARLFALDIIDANDKGEFGQAWGLLDDALTWRPPSE